MYIPLCDLLLLNIFNTSSLKESFQFHWGIETRWALSKSLRSNKKKKKAFFNTKGK